ncbi:Receptor-like serine/threonine-protein kinase [Heracleum sosnowskyi]|uniref:Receptor-like serine/threonine-protein kinase n=1 Tax=Heracleum sosnowskyi TaxID=360622 RepID=A0AAD8HXB5_9APIA|nr:Receptor-like serine/threonine-protein kinase [Heracleum sosnowskyi]
MQLFKKMVPATKLGSFQLRMILTFLYIFSNLKVGAGLDILSPGRPLYSNETLISKRSKCALGFFSPGNSTNIYVGIWYNTFIYDRQILWVANREAPIRSVSDNSRLEVSEDGTLILFNDLNEKIWVVNNSVGSSSVSTTGLLLDDANFVISDGMSRIWQSFDYPTHTWLPGMKLANYRTLTEKRLFLTSWKNPDDPASGNFSLGIEPNERNELFMWTNITKKIWGSGPWNGQHFSSFPTNFIQFNFIMDSQETSFKYYLDESIPSIFVLSHDGKINELVWSERADDWNTFSSQPVGDCGFALCGPNGLCSTNSTPPCQCLDGFKPNNREDWRLAYWYFGCTRIKPLQCHDIGFRHMVGISMPANPETLNLNSTYACQLACLGNCSCTAYSFSNGSCSLWTGDLLDMRSSGNSQAGFYLRFSKIPSSGVLKKKKRRIFRAKNRKKKEAEEANENILFLDLETSTKQNTDSKSTIANSTMEEKKIFNLPRFSFSSISAATNNFSPANKLGEGGFGPVFKGNLLGGHSVAVKRLSKRSGQGLEELRNETVLIAKLQHRNLVRILGCCIEEDEKILIYEYMSNKSLDHFLFDPSKQDLLDWRIRVQIIEGITQGLLYLHLHSRLRIVHRDLKASNILLDDKMNPKISDFGMARIFGGDELQANTNRIVGTYGYMSPEYAMEGLFSIKSDVFAFGVLLLEILSGRKNTGFRHSDCLSLLGYAWELWKADRVLELVDSNLEIPYSFVPVRLIHVGLLCVQESPEDRPTMSDVLAMFSNEHIQLVSPRRPAFTSGGSSGTGIDKADNVSVNNLTASVIKGR